MLKVLFPSLLLPTLFIIALNVLLYMCAHDLTIDYET